MDKNELKEICEEIDDRLRMCAGGSFDSGDLEFVRTRLRYVLGGEQPAYVTLTYEERSMLTDMDYHSGDLNLCFDGDEFIATKENIEALEGVIDRFKEKIMNKVKE